MTPTRTSRIGRRGILRGGITGTVGLALPRLARAQPAAKELVLVASGGVIANAFKKLFFDPFTRKPECPLRAIGGRRNARQGEGDE